MRLEGIITECYLGFEDHFSHHQVILDKLQIENDHVKKDTVTISTCLHNIQLPNVFQCMVEKHMFEKFLYGSNKHL